MDKANQLRVILRRLAADHEADDLARLHAEAIGVAGDRMAGNLRFRRAGQEYCQEKGQAAGT
jgi:hypothetical protein